LASGLGGAISAIPGLNLGWTMVAGAAGNVLSQGIKGNIQSWADFGKSAAYGAVSNAAGWLVSSRVATLKVKEIENMTRDTKKIYLREVIFRDSQKYVNYNLQIFANSSMPVKKWLVENGLLVFRAGVYSTLTSTTIVNLLS